MLHVIGAIKKTCKQSRVIVGIGSTYMGLTLHMNKILTYLIINSSGNSGYHKKGKTYILRLMHNDTNSKNEFS